MPCPKNVRVDRDGRAKAGSQKQIQIYVNERETEFSRKLMEVLNPPAAPGATLKWVSPRANDNFNEYRDSEFLDKLELSEHRQKLQKFWPSRGPCWDALAIVRDTNLHGAVLIEAKSHITEMGSACKAESARSEEMIKKALDETAQHLGAAVNSHWTEEYYQTANRYAHLYFLRKIALVPAWLVNVYFTNDRSVEPTSRSEWEKKLEEIRQLMGLGGNSIPFTAELFLEAVNS